MRFVISANHPRTAYYYSVVRLSRCGYTDIVTRELTNEEYLNATSMEVTND